MFLLATIRHLQRNGASSESLGVRSLTKPVIGVSGAAVYGCYCIWTSPKVKALQLFPTLYPELDSESFKACSGWFHKFCCRHCVREIYLPRESLSAVASAAIDAFRSKLFSKM